MGLVKDKATATLDTVWGDMRSTFESVSTFGADKTTTVDGSAFSIKRDKDTYVIGFTEGSGVWYSAGWDLDSIAATNEGSDVTWNDNEFFREGGRREWKGAQDCVYYIGEGSGFAWCVFWPIEDLDGTDSYQRPVSFCVAEITKLWDWYPEYECLQNAFQQGGSGSVWYRDDDRSWCGLRSNSGNSRPYNDRNVSIYQTGSLTGANKWLGTEKNLVMAHSISGVDDGVKMGTFEGWGYDHEFDSNNTIPSGSKIDTGTGKSFIYLDPQENLNYGPNFFQY